MTIARIKYRYLKLRWLETILFGVATGMFVAAACFALHFSFVLAFAVTCITIVWRAYSLGLSKVDDLKIALYLNRFYPELKESGDLLIKDPGSMTTLEQIQLNRISIPAVKLPHKLFMAIVLFVVSVSISAFVVWMYSIGLLFQTVISESKFNPNNDDQIATVDPSIKSVEITTIPPSYTHLPKTQTSNLSFSVPEGSTVAWDISFNVPVTNIKLMMTGSDSILDTQRTQHTALRTTRTSHLTTILSNSVLYRLHWNDSLTTDYQRIDVKPDHIPQVAIKDLPQFTRLRWGEKNTIDVSSIISDDYGLSQAHVIATVSKGSGESVKFREEKLSFASPTKINGTNINGKLTLDFRKLGMDPGDEVYFYVEAFDNKQPQSQRNRTDTYFVALQDTAQQEISMDEGLGVDLMPDYFRSQRQLIIDTEKLLADQKAKKVTKQQFNSTSNELGYDQKVLRLRYGQFLGEEFETSIGEDAAEHAEREENEKNEADEILKRFGHQHDTKNEHNLVAEKKEESGGEHDNTDQATFFTQSIKAKLRAALSLMWNSELKLRMFTPKESLPTQYQILKLLKEISQDSRIYVHRMGFDPPPLKEERRLVGSLDEVKPAGIENKMIDDYQYPAIRAALSDISNVLLDESIVLDDQQSKNLHAAGDELAALALTSPGNYLQALSDLKSIAENKMDSTAIRSKLEAIQQIFWTVLPNEAPAPTQRGSGAHSLDLKFLEEVKAKTND